MNEKLKEKLIDIFANIFAYSIIGYILISWFFAILLFFYEFIIGPISNILSPELTDSYNLLVQQVSSLNINSSEFLNAANSMYQQSIQISQLNAPLPINQFIEDELILIVPPAILLGLIYYIAKKENNDE